MSTFLTLLLFFSASFVSPSNSAAATTSSSPSRYFKALPHSLQPKKSQEYFEVTNPLPSDHLVPSCTVHVIHHAFANTINQPPFSVLYSPPQNCPPPWSYVVLEFKARCKGDQYDRISGLWLGGAELLRTSTAEPSEAGISWKVRKDITKYSSLLKNKNLNFTVMLENIVNGIYTGIYHVKVNLLFYKDNAVTVPFNRKLGIVSGIKAREHAGALELQESQAPDLVIPVSDDGRRGHWFWIENESDRHCKKIVIPRNSYKAVLELYASFHSNDEFWYSNPPNSYIRDNNLTTSRGNGAYREVYVKIDGGFVGSVFPFPVIFTGGINPLFWEPVVAIGAFNLPSYDLDLTPFLGTLLGRKGHEIEIGVTDAISYWLVDANLHVWLDHSSPTAKVEAKSVFRGEPSFLSIEREEEFQQLDGTFKIKAKRTTVVAGWVKSSSGNLTTIVSSILSFKNSIKFKNNGTLKMVKQKIKSHTETQLKNEMGKRINRSSFKRKYPLKVITATLPGSRKETYMLVTNVSHAMNEKHFIGGLSSTVYNNQVSNGWMEVKDHDVLSGDARTNQSFMYRGNVLGCYWRSVAAVNGKLVSDTSAYACPSIL
ncbi:peptide-N4-(N-acetyl-beta-glucosaminyl)asparagine amidase A [Tripterygium wilfordii]|uniref:Peptide-N4-(N-acetyl-beta-glucosaminyl)asparagine amidase A n=2 Tax=Tripterygium wilfordii TaxID=458696 RepID=A0A7J7CR05_TRIWF|nr:peptide-N4-(N-acetyl-beta-glucosaminyl)asparagine amidase A [Tripterygium wilfordii]